MLKLNVPDDCVSIFPCLEYCKSFQSLEENKYSIIIDHIKMSLFGYHIASFEFQFWLEYIPDDWKIEITGVKAIIYLNLSFVLNFIGSEDFEKSVRDAVQGAKNRYVQHRPTMRVPVTEILPFKEIKID